MVYCKTIPHNTNYYRRNKEQRFNVKCCPHCNYETTGPKSALLAHIYSKHTPENKRPFQCPCTECERGYAARANLKKHLIKNHDTNMNVFNKNSFCFLTFSPHLLLCNFFLLHFLCCKVLSIKCLFCYLRYSFLYEYKNKF